MKEQLKNKFVAEMAHQGATPEQINLAVSALCIALQGYAISLEDKKEIVECSALNEAYTKIREYVQSRLAEGLAKGSARNITYSLPKFFCFCNKAPKDVEAMDIRAYLAHRKINENLRESTLNNIRQQIMGFYNWLVAENYIDKSPCGNVKKIKEPKREKKALDGMELEVIRSVLEDDRDKAIVEFLYSTACRVAELHNVKVADIDFQHGTVILFGKGKKERIGYLTPRCVLALKTYLDNRKVKSDYLITTSKGETAGSLSRGAIADVLRRIEKICGDKINHHLHPHLFRHTTATIASEKGMPIEEIQAMLGHSCISTTTTTYVKVNQAKVQQDHSRCIG